MDMKILEKVLQDTENQAVEDINRKVNSSDLLKMGEHKACH